MYKFFKFCLAVILLIGAGSLGWYARYHIDQPQCNDARLILQSFMAKYGEKPVTIGKVTDGGYMIVTATEDGSTWTLFRAPNPNLLCVIYSGEGLMAK